MGYSFPLHNHLFVVNFVCFDYFNNKGIEALLQANMFIQNQETTNITSNRSYGMGQSIRITVRMTNIHFLIWCKATLPRHQSSKLLTTIESA
jgi:hypothetical protein